MTFTYNLAAELPDREAEEVVTRHPRRHHILGTRVILQTVASILFGGVAYVVTNLLSPTENSQFPGITLSVLIGGIALVFQLMIDLDHRLEGLQMQIKAEFKEEFTKIHKVTELFQAMEKLDQQTVAAMRLLQHATRIEPHSQPLISAFAHSQINEMSRLLRGLNEGESVIYDGEDRDWMLGLTTYCKESIDATSLSTVDAGVNSFEGGLWTSDLGQRYLELQRLAVERRKVRIRRVFIILDSHGQA